MALARGQITITSEDYLLDKTRVKVEGKTLDPNKYYPLIIKLAAPYKDARIYGIRIERPLYDKSLGVPPYASHNNGYTLTLEWSVQGQGWGAQGHNRRIYSYETKFLRDGELVISAPNQEYRSSWEYVYLRGGSDVWVEVTGGTDIDIALYPEGALWESGTYNYRWEVLDSIARLGEPKIDLDTLKDSMLAEVAKARSDLQGIITRAQEASGEAFQREVQSVLASVSSLTAKLDETAGNLQKQIDKQVERWFGDSMARSGVPPTNLWDAADNAKHEGDTYTCVAPRGVTITPANAHEYPNVGKSWRWTNGGSGTAYGWVLIADTDITQALALASKAQATADGKMTHYTTTTPPVSYQRGDQWTLPTAWQGRKGGRAYTYPAGSILTATADSIAGQHHPEHWAELVRYTDLKIEDIKVGGRNLALRSAELPAKEQAEYNIMLGRVSQPWVLGGIYSITARVSIMTDNPSPEIWMYPNRGMGTLGRVIGTDIVSANGWVTATYQWVGKVIEQVHIRGDKQDYGLWCGTYKGVNAYRTQVHWVMIEEGNKPSTWQPAPEDVQAEAERKANEAERRAKEHADNKARAEAAERAKLAKLLQTQEERTAALDYLKAVLTKGKSEPMRVQGGSVQIPLLLGNYIGIVDLEGKLRATLSGDTKGGLFMSAGLDDDGVPNVEVMHDGRARFGQLYLNPDGTLAVKRSTTAPAYALFGGSLPRLDTLFDRTGGVRNHTQAGSYHAVLNGISGASGIDRPASSGEEEAPLMRSEERVIMSGIVIKASHRVSITGRIVVNASDGQAGARRGSSEATCSVRLRPTAGGAGMRSIGYAFATSLTNGQTVNLNWQDSTLPEGTYELVASADLISARDPHASASASVDGCVVRLDNTTDYHFTGFGDNGFAALFGEGRYLYVSDDAAGAFVRSRGAWDISGVLLSGGCMMSQSITRLYDPRGRNVSATKRGENVVRLTHNIGHTQYSVSITPVFESGMESSPYIVMVTARTSNYIDVTCWRQWGSSTHQRVCAFDFVFTGINN